MKEMVSFLLSKVFFKHLALAIVIAFGLLFLVFFSLGLYTHHGRTQPVPDFHGLTEAQLAGIVKGLDLRYQIIDSVHMAHVGPGAVVEQTPKPGSQVKKNRTVFLTINALSREMVLTPRLTDYSLRNALSILESYGLRTGKLVYVPSEFTNLVIGQHFNGKPIAPGTPVEKGTAIDLLVGEGLSDEKTNLPDLLGLTLEEAKGYLKGISLNMGAVAADESVTTSADSASAVIWKQDPSPEQLKALQLGASIDVWITLDSTLISNQSVL